jgi:hypothetical protein
MTEGAPTTYFWLGLVILVSLFLSLYEIFKTFGRDFGRSLGRRYALLLIVLNVGTALVVWWIIHGLLAVEPTFPSTLVTGLTFPALLRSRFTLYRSIVPGQADETSELSLKMDEIYQSIQVALVGEVNLNLAGERVAISKQLRQTFTADEMAGHLGDFIASEPVASEREKHQAQLDAILAIQDADKKHLQLANLLIALKDRAELKRALRDGSLTPP